MKTKELYYREFTPISGTVAFILSTVILMIPILNNFLLYLAYREGIDFKDRGFLSFIGFIEWKKCKTEKEIYVNNN